jgi:hypothetical protein
MPERKPIPNLFDWFEEKRKSKYNGIKIIRVMANNVRKLLKLRPITSEKINIILVKLKEGLISNPPPVVYIYSPARLTSMKSINI